MVVVYAFISPNESLAAPCCVIPSLSPIPSISPLPTLPPIPTLSPNPCGSICVFPTPSVSPEPTVVPSPTPTTVPTPTPTPNTDNGIGGAPLSPAGPPQAPPYVAPVPAVLGLSTTSSGVVANPYLLLLGCLFLSGGFFFLLKK